MTKLLKKFFLLAVAAILAVSVTACGGDDNEDTKTPVTPDTPVVTPETPVPETPVPETPVPETPTPQPEVKPEFTEANYAHGAKSYVAASYDERAKILGVLEKYAVKNNLTGLTLFDNGGYVMYADSVVKGTNTYIPGYGFGILSEGSLSAPLTTENNPNWQYYYHSISASDPKTINYMNDKGSEVGDLVGYSSSSYWGTKMNETADGYDWFAVQSNTERPIAIDGVETGAQVLATKYKFELKVGSEYKYNTNSNVASIAAYDGREVELEDYVTPYKMLWTKAFGMARAADNLTGAGSIKGSFEYYEASADGINEEAWENVGIKTYTEDGKAWMEVEFNTPCNQFYAMYYLSSSLSTPVPASYIELLGDGDFAKGMKVYGNMTDGGWTPVDTYLSTGPYTLETWDADQQIVFARNPYYDIEGEDRYSIEGVHIRVSKAAATDSNHVFDQFLAGNVHAASIPLAYLDEYKDDPRTTTTVGSSTFKLNFNSCTQEEWNALFGVNGSVSKHPESEYWQCEPIMSNDDFLMGLSYALNRHQLATTLGRTPSYEYFASTYLADPENGISYNSTDYHKEAVAHLVEGTNYGYNLEYAKASFKKAAEALIADGTYKVGDTITIEIAWMYPTDEEEMHVMIAKDFEDAFNSAGTGLTLDVEFWVGSAWSDVYYEKMMEGHFDIGFGSISGNSLNPLNFFEVLRSDNSSGFTLNWGCDTSVVSEELYYDGMYWSFDSLWLAADQGAYFEGGQVAEFFTTPAVLDNANIVTNEDGTITLTVDYAMSEIEGLEFALDSAVVFTYVAANNANGYAYTEEECSYELDAENGKLIVTLTAEQVAKYVDGGIAQLLGAGFDYGVDFYYTASAGGVDLSGYNSVLVIKPVADTPAE